MKNGPIDLNIAKRNTPPSNWVTAGGVITPDDLRDVKEQSSDNPSALNSLPTPFARFFVAREAFRRVAQAMNNRQNNAGWAYEQLVSDCLDLYELLFNLKYHRNIWQGKQDIEIREWDAKQDMASLSNTMPKLHRTLSAYFSNDFKNTETGKVDSVFYFIIYKDGKQEHLLGCSSPFTGWVTPPDMDKTRDNTKLKFGADHYNDVRIKRKHSGYYFDGKILFEDRDDEFKNYMYNYLFASGNINYRLAEISSYIKGFAYDRSIDSNFKINLAEILSYNSNPIIVNGLAMQQSAETDVNSFFQSNLIILPYRLDSNSFIGASFERDKTDRDYDFLIPLNAEGLTLLEKGAKCTCQERNSDILVKLNFEGKEYTKIFEEDPSDATKGMIKDLRKLSQYVNLALFPNILSPFDKENNYFKVALVEKDSNDQYTTLNIDKCTLEFYKLSASNEFECIEETLTSSQAINGVYTPVVRSRQNSNNPTGTKYYEIFNTDFAAILITIDGASGFVIPKWKKAARTNDSFTYAIDLGTSNTFISRVKNGQNFAPVQLDMKSTMTSYLHEYKKGNQYSETWYIEDAMPADIKEAFTTEFAPPMIDGILYDFPIRTALCTVKGTPDEPKLFDNTNIAFFYEKVLQSTLQEIHTDIKWEENKQRLAVFVQELLLIIKADILQKNGVLSQTNLIRFRPLSFDGNIKRMNDEVWKDLPAKVFGVEPNHIDCFTESEAPYYYFTKRNIVNNTDSVTVVDIGGGSTDFVYFKANVPQIASSVHFGCDELWGEGHIAFGNARENGIFNKYSQSLLLRDDNIAKINSAMIVDNKVSAKNIINFWLTNQDKSNIKDNLRRDYTPLFVYHLTALIYYMASMFKYKNLDVPRTIVFSGNGSLYIDNFITDDKSIIQEIVKIIFERVYGDCPEIYVTLPTERKESTCYGGLYKDPTIQNVPEVTYHGVEREYNTAKQLIDDKQLMSELLAKYKQMNEIYVNILSKLKNRNVIDKTFNVTPFTEIINSNYENNFSTHFRSEVIEKYKADDDVCNDSVFFIPIIDKLFELTKVV